MELSNVPHEQLENVVVSPAELTELLRRLAVADGMLGEAETTVRDVAELTETSPVAIARILAEIRGPDALDELESRVDEHEVRIGSLEATKGPTAIPTIATLSPQAFERQYREMERRKAARDFEESFPLIIGAVVIVVFVLLVISVAKSNSKDAPKAGVTGGSPQTSPWTRDKRW